MTRSVLAAIRAAMQPGAAEVFPDGEEPGAEASSPEIAQSGLLTNEANMSEPLTPSGTAAAPAGHTEIPAKDAGSHDAGFKAANERIAAVMGCDGIKGDGKRMSAALDLAMSSPGMSTEAITAFVTANVAASGPAQEASAQSQQQSYADQRMAAGGLASPQGGGADKPRSGLSAAVTSHIETMKRTA